MGRLLQGQQPEPTGAGAEAGLMVTDELLDPAFCIGVLVGASLFMLIASLVARLGGGKERLE